MSDGGQSIWKKEISLGRKRKQAEPEATKPESPSVWKKEISFSRKRKDAPAEAKPEQASPWKKEISFSRKRKDAPVGAKPEQPSLLKKEISFGRKKRAEPEPELAAEPRVPFWKKEISLGGKGKSADREVERLAEAAAAAVVPGPLPDPVAAAPPLPDPVVPEELPPEPEPVPAEPAAAIPEPLEPAAPVAAPVVPEPVAAIPEPAAAVPSPGLPEPLPAATPPAPEVPADAEVLYVAPPAEEQTAVMPPLPEPAAAAVDPVRVPEPWEAPPEVPPAPVAAPKPVVHPPVPASELPPLPQEPKTPWWKKELGGKKPRSAILPEDDDAPRVPWWKKEIGGSRKPKAPKAEQPHAEPSTPKTPWWKKELGGAKKAQPAQDAAPAAEAPTAPARAPFWKKELSLARKPKVASPPQPKQKPTRSGGSFLKLDLGSLALPSLSGGRAKRDQKLKKVVGLKVGGSQIAAARVVNNGHAELLQLARQPLEQGVVVGGELRDPEALSEQLKAFFARHKLPRRNVRLGIASNRIGVRIFDVAGIVDDKALTNAIQFRAQEALPIPLDEAVLDYQVVGESVDAEGQPVKRILLVVAYRELVDRYVAACRKAGISLVGIDLEAFALLRALAAPRPETTEATAAIVAVAVGHDRSTFAVSDGRVCEFTRVLEWGGAAVSVSIARALDLAPSEVEAIKRSLVLDGSAIPDGLTQEQYAAAVDAVRKQIQAFARELVSSLQFYQNQPGSLGIGEIVLSGGTAHLPGLADELQRLIGVSVRVGDPLGRVKVAKRIGSPEQVGSLAVAIGLGIED